MSCLTEFAAQYFAIKLFERLGCRHIHAWDIATDGDNLEKLCDNLLPKLMRGEVRVAA